jgi:serine/threonine protein kinase
MGSMNHAHIIKMIGISWKDDNAYLIMELVPHSLQKLLDTRVLTHEECMEVAGQTASALMYIHSKEMSHRDIKADNILLQDFRTNLGRKDIVVKVVDFGLSKSAYEERSTKEIGTPGFMSPELLEAVGEIGYDAKKVDVWAFGVLFYYLWTQKEPYKGLTTAQICNRISNSLDDKPSLDIPMNCPDQVKSLLMACWRLNPSERPTMEEVVTQILPGIISLPPPTPRHHRGQSSMSEALGTFLRILHSPSPSSSASTELTQRPLRGFHSEPPLV